MNKVRINYVQFVLCTNIDIQRYQKIVRELTIRDCSPSE